MIPAPILGGGVSQRIPSDDEKEPRSACHEGRIVGQEFLESALGGKLTPPCQWEKRWSLDAYHSMDLPNLRSAPSIAAAVSAVR